MLELPCFSPAIYCSNILQRHAFGSSFSINRSTSPSSSTNRGISGKIDVDVLVAKATQKLGEVTFQQKKHIVERVINKVIASPQEVTIWGQIPLTAVLATRKVKNEPVHRQTKVLTQLPFELKLAMPRPDSGQRGYSNQYVSSILEKIS